ncbi:MAG: hypothetical protein ACRC1K_20410 [Planctomycetia bacterium]
MNLAFDAGAYGPEFAPLAGFDRIPPLGPGNPVPEVYDALRSLRESLGRRDAVDESMVRCVLSGVWLLFDYLDESHELSQSIPTSTGAAWHGVMHRREPDAFNSKYWIRQAGPHSLYDRLVETAPSVGYDYRTPEAFVDFCEKVRDTGSADEETAKRVQKLEWRLLFDHCHRAAFG